MMTQASWPVSSHGNITFKSEWVATLATIEGRVCRESKFLQILCLLKFKLEFAKMKDVSFAEIVCKAKLQTGFSSAPHMIQDFLS